MNKRKSLLLVITVIISLLALAGTALAQDPSVTVTSPPPGMTVDAAAPINITGTAANLPAGATILVHTRVSDADADDTNDPVAGEATVAADVAGNWHASVNLTVALSPGIPGNIIAYVQVSGTTVATSNIVNITYGGSGEPTATPTATFTATTEAPTATPTATSTTPVNTATPTATNPAQPRVTITSPVQNAIFPTGVAIAVTGTGANLFEGNVVVRALNANSDVLTQVPTVLDAAGNWIAYLTVNVPTGTLGSIYAFSTSPINGAVVASSHVEVTYGGPCVVRTDWFTYTVQSGDTLFRIAQRVGSNVNELALANCLSNTNLVYVGQVLRVPRLPVQQPTASPTSLRILSPAQNAVLDTSVRVPVNGTGRGIAGYSVVVRALDAQGRVLAQQVSTASAANAAGDSTWQVNLSIVAQAGTPGSIYAYAVAPNTGATAADTLINVVFGGTAQTVPTPTPAVQQPTPPPVIGGDVTLEINVPADNSVLPFSLPIVNGRVFGLTEGDVVVRALDNEGAVLTEVITSLLAPTTAGAPATWQVSLELDVAPATYGIIYAYLPTPFEGSVIADAVNVAYGQATTGQYITISDPLPYAIVPIDTPLIVSGRGGRLFEGALVVRALDDEGNVLAEAPTIVDSPNAGTGGEGDWQVSLGVNVTPGTRGWLYAFATSANDGSVVASARVPVIIGDPTTRTNFVQITTPLPDTRILAGNALLIAGRVDLNSSQQVTVAVVDALGNVLIEEPRPITPLPELNYGTWEIILELRNLPDGMPVLVNAFTTSPFDSSILASDTIGLVVSDSGAAPSATQAPEQPGGARG